MANDGTVKIGTELDKKGLENGLSGLGSFAKKGFSAVGSAAATAGKAVAGTIGAAATGVATLGAASIAAGKDFETTMAAASTLFGSVNVDTNKLHASILQISDSTGIAASELNSSLYSALSAGIPVTEDMGAATAFLESSAKLAKAGFTDMDTALSATAKTLNAYGLDVSEADRINKILIQTQNKGITTVGELGASLAQVTPTAAAFGVSFENVGAALANMTAAGTPTAQATTQLNSLIAELGKNGTVGAKSLEKATRGTQYAGMGFKQLMDAGVPLNSVLDMIRQSADDSGLSMVDMFSSIEAGKAALALSGENSKKFTDNLAAMGTSADVVGEAYDKVTDTLETKTGRMAESAKNLGIRIYQGMQEPLMGLADMGIDCLNRLTTAFAEDGIEGLINAGASVVVDIVTGAAQQLPALVELGASLVSTLLGAISSNSGELASAAASAVSGLITGILELLPQFLETGMQLIADLGNGIASQLPTLIPLAVEAVFNLVDTFLDNIDSLIDAGINLLMAVVDGIVNAIPVLVEKGPEIIIKLCNAFANNLPKLITAGIQLIGKLAEGLLRAIPDLISNIPQIIQAIVKSFATFNWLSIGKDIIKGVTDGVVQAAKGLVNAVVDTARKAVQGVKDFLGIHSPSRLMRDMIGKNMIAGVNVGIDEKSDEMSEHAVSGMRRTTNVMKEEVASGYVARMRGQIEQPVLKNDTDDPWKHPGNSGGGGQSDTGNGIDYDKMGTAVKKAMNGVKVVMDGRETGQIIAPYVDSSLGEAERKKVRG